MGAMPLKVCFKVTDVKHKHLTNGYVAPISVKISMVPLRLWEINSCLTGPGHMTKTAAIW